MDEEKVIEMCKRGDLSAYRALYDRYEQPLLRTACRMLGRQEDAEDAVQDAFLRLFRGIDGFRSGARFSTYFFRILMNACFDVLRKRKGAEFKDLDIEKMPFHSSCEDKHALAEAVGALPEDEVVFHPLCCRRVQARGDRLDPEHQRGQRQGQHPSGPQEAPGVAGPGPGRRHEMNCKRYDDHLLGKMKETEFRRHAEGCASCKEQADRDERLRAGLVFLKQPISAPDLWARIEESLKKEHRIKARPGRSEFLAWVRRKIPVLVPAALVAVGIGLGLIFGLRDRPPVSGLLAKEALQKVELTEREYVKAIDDLERKARPKMAFMDPGMMSLYRDKLEAIDSQIARCREALGVNSANAHIRRYMLAALQAKHQTLAELLTYE